MQSVMDSSSLLIRLGLHQRDCFFFFHKSICYSHHSESLCNFFHVGELCEGAINLGMIMINLENTTQLGDRFSSKVIDDRYLKPIF